jgi:hypothetical protein
LELKIIAVLSLGPLGVTGILKIYILELLLQNKNNLYLLLILLKGATAVKKEFPKATSIRT